MTDFFEVNNNKSFFWTLRNIINFAANKYYKLQPNQMTLELSDTGINFGDPYEAVLLIKEINSGKKLFNLKSQSLSSKFCLKKNQEIMKLLHQLSLKNLRLNIPFCLYILDTQARVEATHSVEGVSFATLMKKCVVHEKKRGLLIDACTALGQTLTELHHASLKNEQTIVHSETTVIDRLQSLSQSVQQQPQVSLLIKFLLEKFDTLPKNYGLIHANLTPKTAVWEPVARQLTLTDVSDMCIGHKVQDLAWFSVSLKLLANQLGITDELVKQCLDALTDSYDGQAFDDAEFRYYELFCLLSQLSNLQQGVELNPFPGNAYEQMAQERLKILNREIGKLAREIEV